MIFQAINAACTIVALCVAAFKKLPRGERRCGEEGGTKIRASCAPNEVTTLAAGGRTRRGGFLRLGRSTHHESVLYGTARGTSAARRGIFQSRPLSSLPNPLWTRPAAPARFSRALYAAATTNTSAFPTTCVRTCDLALPCSSARDDEEKRGTRAEKWHDERAERSRKSFYKERRCQTRRHLIMESRRVFYSKPAWRSLGYPYFFVSLLQHVMFSILISVMRVYCLYRIFFL